MIKKRKQDIRLKKKNKQNQYSSLFTFRLNCSHLGSRPPIYVKKFSNKNYGAQNLPMSIFLPEKELFLEDGI